MQRGFWAFPALLPGLIGSATAVAQAPADDWDFGEDPARKLSIAAVSFETFGVAVRCLDGRLSVVLSGLPVTSGERRLRYSMGDTTIDESLWISGTRSSAAFSVWPRSVAAGMSRGGRLSISVPDGTVSRRFEVDLPASPQSIDRVFQACGEELDPPPSDAPPSDESFSGFRWRSGPDVNFPSRTTASAGLAAITCVVRHEGRLRDCRIESEFPEGGGFGRAATFGAHRTARIEPVDGAAGDGDGRRVSFIVRYRASDY